MKQSEQSLYITLIDFLIQIIFVGLVIGVVYAVAQNDDPQPKANSQNKLEEIAKSSGMTVTELTDYLSKLGPIQTLGPAESVAGHVKLARELVENAGGVDEAKAVIDKTGGQGSKSCLPDKKAIVTFHAYSDRIEVRDKSKEFAKLLSEINVDENNVHNMTLPEFSRKFSMVRTKHPNCRYNVRVIEYSDFTKPRDTIRSCFWPLTYERSR